LHIFGFQRCLVVQPDAARTVGGYAMMETAAASINLKSSITVHTTGDLPHGMWAAAVPGPSCGETGDLPWVASNNGLAQVNHDQRRVWNRLTGGDFSPKFSAYGWAKWTVVETLEAGSGV